MSGIAQLVSKSEVEAVVCPQVILSLRHPCEWCCPPDWQVYKAVLRETGEQVAVKVQRPGVEPVIVRDLFIFRIIAKYINSLARQRLGCNAELIVDEFGEKLMEELDYQQEARNIAVSHHPAREKLACRLVFVFGNTVEKAMKPSPSSL